MHADSLFLCFIGKISRFIGTILCFIGKISRFIGIIIYLAQFYS